MPDPMPTLNKFLNVRRTLPNGGGQFNVANSTPSGVTTPVQAPDAGLMHALANVGGYTGGQEIPVPPVTPPGAPSVPPASTPAPVSAPSATPDLESLIKKYSSNDNSRLYGVGGPSSNTGDAPMDFMSLREEQLRDRANGTGLYALPQGVSLTPDQIFGLRSMADNHYSDLIQSATAYSKEQIEEKKANEETSVGDNYNNDPWMRGIVLTGQIGGGTTGERTRNEKMMAQLPEDVKKEMVIASVYNKMSVGERDAFNASNRAVAGVNAIVNSIPDELSQNPLKYQTTRVSEYLGGKRSPEYQNFVSLVGNVKAPIINQTYGAAVTGSEYARALEWLPGLESQSLETVITNLKNLAAFNEFANDSSIASRIGMPKPKLDDYLDKYHGREKTSSSSTGDNSYATEW